MSAALRSPEASLLRHPTHLFAGYVFDLDGTVYLGDSLLPTASTTIAALRALRRRVIFVTNNPLHRGGDYAARLTRLGIPTDAHDVVTALDSLVLYLSVRHRGVPVFTISESLVETTLLAAGQPLTTDPERAGVVVVSFDRTFDYAKLHAAYQAVRAGAAIVATNPDPYCPTPEGGLPDCAAMLAAVEACTGQRAEAVVGKPSPHMAAAFLDRLGVPAEEAVMVGDRLLTDIAMAGATGMASALTLTGATGPEDLADAPVRPDYIIHRLADLIPSPTWPLEELS
jgi:HAD superfamily hydrolase (TIGR01450 family)